MGATAQTQLVGVTVLQGQLQKAGFDPQLKIGDGDAMYSFVFDHTFQSYNFYGDTGLLGMDPAYLGIAGCITARSRTRRQNQGDAAEDRRCGHHRGL